MSVSLSGQSFQAMDSSFGAEIYSASLAKRQQQMEGQAALALIESAVSSAPTSQPANGRVGTNINVVV